MTSVKRDFLAIPDFEKGRSSEHPGAGTPPKAGEERGASAGGEEPGDDLPEERPTLQLGNLLSRWA